eukprot:1441916-Amphidinium_carterae.1
MEIVAVFQTNSDQTLLQPFRPSATSSASTNILDERVGARWLDMMSSRESDGKSARVASTSKACFVTCALNGHRCSRV